MSEIVITGASGVVGWRAVYELQRAGHGVAGVTRSPRGRRVLESLGARAVYADVFDEASLTAAFAGADAVVNLLTHIPAADRVARHGAWDENDRLRREASAAVALAAQAAGAERLVQESMTFLYADGGDAWLDEQAPAVGGGTTSSALVAEANAAELFPGDTVVLRFGQFVGPDSDLTKADLAAARAGVSTTVGRRYGYLPTVWLDDAGRAVVAALDAPAGTYNVVDDEPATRGEIDAALAAVVGRPSLRPAVTGVVPPELEPVSRSQRASNRRLHDATGWAPRVRAGLDGWRLITETPLAA
ncbi:MAG TPA: NAD(P)H-binding protein [Solirubrobacteraceae bacterium]|jgi:UDP-glucose 4-epimerase|nr:NAD(P)H-binding protein [Solirubrobacteraceae bacterium]